MAKSSNEKNYMPLGQCRQVVLVGCGGTGSILAEHLGRMIAGFRLDVELILYDGDTVEDANIARQNFQPYEVGANKAEAIALRLAGQFGIAVSANAKNISGRDFNRGNYSSGMVISCTDTLQSRRIIAQSGRYHLWLDTGNERHHGQAVIGTTHKADVLRKAFNDFCKKPFTKELPDIAAMNPSILKARRSSVKAGCAAQPFALQGFGVNAMSALAAASIAKQVLVDRKVTSAAIYFNVSEGRMAARAVTKDLFNQWK